MITGQDSEVLTLEEYQMQDHRHGISDPGHTHPYVDWWLPLHENAQYYGTGTLYHGSDREREMTTSSHTTGVTVTGSVQLLPLWR